MIAHLLNIPQSPSDWLDWGWHHYDDHRAIREKIVQLGGPDLPDYIINPIQQEDIANWLVRHQQLHIDMDGVLRLQSVDLQGVDFKDARQVQAWIFSNYQEHFAAREKLGI